jgi:hypothetical protein
MMHRLCNVCAWYWCYLVSENLESRVKCKWTAQTVSCKIRVVLISVILLLFLGAVQSNVWFPGNYLICLSTCNSFDLGEWSLMKFGI